MIKRKYYKDYHCFKKGKNEHEKAKVLLVYPNVGSEARNISLYPPLSLLYIASYLKDFSVAIFDQRVDNGDMFIELLKQKPVCVGFSIMTGPQIKHGLELARVVKDADIPTVFGGVHASILPDQSQVDERVDYIVTGEGEVTFRNLVESLLKNKNSHPIIKSEYVDLNNMPSLPYDLVNVEDYVYSVAIEGRALPVTFSRGCPFACTFCCSPVITKRKWRTADVDLAITQLNELVDTYDLDSVIFWDENLMLNPKIISRLAAAINGRFKWFAQSRSNALLKYDLSFLEKMGLFRISCGLESGSPKILRKIKKEEDVNEYLEANKMLASTNINVWYNYIVGFPEETIDDVRMTIQLAMQILDENPNAINSTFYVVAPYPGTEIGGKFLRSNNAPKRLEDWARFSRHNFNSDWYAPEESKIFERICFSSKFVGKKIIHHFPDDKYLKKFTEELSGKWRRFDFNDDDEWQEIHENGWEILNRLFGDKAY